MTNFVFSLSLSLFMASASAATYSRAYPGKNIENLPIQEMKIVTSVRPDLNDLRTSRIELRGNRTQVDGPTTYRIGVVLEVTIGHGDLGAAQAKLLLKELETNQSIDLYSTTPHMEGPIRSLEPRATLTSAALALQDFTSPEKLFVWTPGTQQSPTLKTYLDNLSKSVVDDCYSDFQNLGFDGWRGKLRYAEIIYYIDFESLVTFGLADSCIDSYYAKRRPVSNY